MKGQKRRIAVTIVKRSDDLRGFVILPRRWVAERTFAWLTRYRRLVRIYERKPEHHEAMIWWARVHQMTRELAGQPPPGRWSDPPPLPNLSSPGRRQGPATPGRRALASLERVELAAILGIENINSFRIQLSQWSHQGYINKIGPALYSPMPTRSKAFASRLLKIKESSTRTAITVSTPKCAGGRSGWPWCRRGLTSCARRRSWRARSAGGR
ncbi:transposase [Nonomuraea sp. NPDC052129]|uniref:transposase n=1 Tax=Nonomuraea sp. NPDC052129 TaxID=3154651 RepID=UPI0034155047